ALTAAPYCYTEVRAGVTNLACDTSPAIVTISSTTSSPNTSAPSSSPTVSGAAASQTSASDSGSDSQITPPPTVPPLGIKAADESSGLSTGVVVGIAVGVVGALAVIGVLAFLLWRKSRNEPKSELLSENGQYQGLSPPDYKPVTENTPGNQQGQYGKAGNHYPAPGNEYGPAELESGSASLPAELGS
ncbi:hypothetical protein Q9L58_008642, partial [Maublancomyces gigas]